MAGEHWRVVGKVCQNLSLIFILFLDFVTFTNIYEGLWNHELLMLSEELQLSEFSKLRLDLKKLKRWNVRDK